MICVKNKEREEVVRVEEVLAKFMIRTGKWSNSSKGAWKKLGRKNYIERRKDESTPIQENGKELRK